MYQPEFLKKNTRKRRNSSKSVEQELGALFTDLNQVSYVRENDSSNEMALMELAQRLAQPNSNTPELQIFAPTQQAVVSDSSLLSTYPFPTDNYSNSSNYFTNSFSFGETTDYYSIPETYTEMNSKQSAPNSVSTVINNDFDIDKALALSTDEIYEANVQKLTQELIHSIGNTGNKKKSIVSNASKIFDCDICQKKYNYKCSLTRHKRLHTGKKLYACDICQKKFTWKHHLPEHKRLHTGKKPYSCDFCQKKFTQKGTLTRHKRTHMV